METPTPARYDLPEGPPAPPPIAPQRRRHSPRLNLILLLATLLSLSLGWALFYEGSLQLAAGLPYAVWVLAILGSHEMGHYLACRYYRIPATLPYFIPGVPPIGTFGAVIRIRGPITDRRALFDIAAAGPIAGFVVALPVLIVGLLQAETFDPTGDGGGAYLMFGDPWILTLLASVLRPGESIQMNPALAAGWVGMLVTSLNLFPVGQLDGGHAVYAWSRRLHVALTYLTLVALPLLILDQALRLRQFPAYTLWFAILLWMRHRHPRLLDERPMLGPGRKLLTLLLLLMFALSFIAIPIRVVETGP